MKGAIQMKPLAELNAKFNELVQKDPDAQLELFLKSFIFALDDQWKEVVVLATKFKDYLLLTGEGNDLNAAQAADFLQKNGKTRTAVQRREEIKDVDLDKNDRIAFVEYLLLHFKPMILREWAKRYGVPVVEDLSKDGIGVTGVGHKLLDELFTLPIGLDPALEKAIEEFTARKRERENKLKDLNVKANQGGVKGLAAKNEIEQMKSQDLTEMNRIELTLNAAKKKASKNSGEDALRAKQQKEEDEKRAKAAESRARLAARASAFNNANQ